MWSRLIRLSALNGVLIVPLHVPGELKPCNPSIASSADGFRCIIRTVNYELNDKGGMSDAAFNSLRTINWLADLDSEFQIVQLRQIADDDFPICNTENLTGLEDCRLFHWRGGWWFSATVVTSGSPTITKIALCRLDGAKVAERRLLPSPKKVQVEKNWMPSVKGAALRWIYWVEPTEVAFYREEDAVELKCIGRTGRLAGWRGSSQCIPYRGNLLCVVHKRYTRKAGISFTHRFVEFSEDFQVKRVSQPFIFETVGIEFCAGFCIANNNAVLSYGVHDRQAHLIRISLSDVEAMLHPYVIPQSLVVFFAELIQSRWMRQPRKQVHAVIKRWFKRR